MTVRTPIFYDASLSVHRPMDVSDTVSPTVIPVSQQVGNLLQNESDGLYYGFQQDRVYYVNASSGSDTSGTGASPSTAFQTLDHTITTILATFPGGVYTGQIYVAMAAGQTYPLTGRYTLNGGSLTFVFYGDPTYGSWNSPPLNNTNISELTQLQRPTITPQMLTLNSQNALAGFTLLGGAVSMIGVKINLPAAPTNPSIANYGGLSDFITYATQLAFASRASSIHGSIVNMTDPTAYWGLIGIEARSVNNYFHQYNSQFQINGLVMSAANSPTTQQLQARQYFVKFYQDYAGNNQQQIWLLANSGNSSSGSGILDVTWSDTENLVVAPGVTSLSTFPVSFDATYGLKQYIHGLITLANGTPTNFRNSRLM